MKWVKYRIEIKKEAEEVVSALLYDLGVYAIQIEDAVLPKESIEKEGGLYEELMPELPEDDGLARIIFYLEEGDDLAEPLLEKIRHGILDRKKTTDIGPGVISISVSDDGDWRDNWKEFFHAFQIGHLLIKPTWEDNVRAEPGCVTLEIDPGMAFGTGQHETTRMCLEELDRLINEGDEVLDVGIGSGILSIASILLGAGHVFGTDIDQYTFDVVHENFKVNNIDDKKGEFYIGDLSSDEKLREKVGKGRFDIVVANILADVIISMRQAIYDAMKPGAILIASGIIDFRENDVLSSLTKQGFVIIDAIHLGDWVEITAKREIV